MEAAIMNMLETLAISDAKAFKSIAARVQELRLAQDCGDSDESNTSSHRGCDQAATTTEPTIKSFHPDFKGCAADDAVILLSTEGVGFRYSLGQLAKYSSLFSGLSDLPDESQAETDATAMNRIIEPPYGTTRAIHLGLSLISCPSFTSLTSETLRDQSVKWWNEMMGKSLYEKYLHLEETTKMLDACDFSDLVSIAVKNILKVSPDNETFDAFAVAAAMDWGDVAQDLSASGI